MPIYAYDMLLFRNEYMHTKCCFCEMYVVAYTYTKYIRNVAYTKMLLLRLPFIREISPLGKKKFVNLFPILIYKQ